MINVAKKLKSQKYMTLDLIDNRHKLKMYWKKFDTVQPVLNFYGTRDQNPHHKEFSSFFKHEPFLF